MFFHLTKIKRLRKYLVITVVIIHFVISPVIQIALAATAEVNFELAVLSPASAGEESTPTTPSVPGNAGPGLVIAPKTETSIFVSGETGFDPYTKILMVSGQAVKAGEILQTYSREPEFLGKTNLKNAIIFLQYGHIEDTVYTTYADIQGVWGFQSPVILNVGWQTLYVTAISPINPYFKAYEVFQFYVAPIPSLDETPDVPPQDDTLIIPPAIPKQVPQPRDPNLPFYYPEPDRTIRITPDEKARKEISDIPKEDTSKTLDIPDSKKAQTKKIFDPNAIPTNKKSLPVVPPTIYYPEKVIYGIDVEIPKSSKSISAGEKIVVKTKITPLPHSGKSDGVKREVDVKLKVLNKDGVVIYEKTEKQDIDEPLFLDKYLKTTPITEPGEYRVNVEIEKDGKVYTSQDTFVIEERPRLGVEALTYAFKKDKLIRLSLIIFICFTIFFVLILRERVLSRKFGKIGREELRRDGYMK